MNPRAAFARRLTILSVTLVGPLAGCAWTPRKVPLDAATGFYQSAALTYRLDAGKLQQPLDVVRVEGQQITYDQVASSPLADQSIGMLSITYPHPLGRAGFAQVKFTLDSTPSKPQAPPGRTPFSKKPAQPPPSLVTSQPEVHEAWALDIPSAQSDQFFKLLSNENYFNTERPKATAAQLTVTINGKQMRKNWEPIAELNALVQRVRREGQLVSYARPTAPAGSPSGGISSTRAYDELLARSGAAAPADAPTSAFSMIPQPASGAIIARLPGTVVR